jgi:tetratricopeptide (TPR) repeat protein
MGKEAGLRTFRRAFHQSPWLVDRAVCAGLVVAGILAYWRLSGTGFVNFDDSLYIYANPALARGFTAEGIRWAFALNNEAAYWHPLTWLSLMFDYRLFGLNPTGYHLENLLLHIGNAVLLFALLKRMTSRLWPSAFVAAVFLLHPINVEAVAWAAERKTVLSTFLGLAAVLAYLRYIRRPAMATYAPVFILMALGLMAKPILLTLPLILLLLDYWPLRRFGLARPALPGEPVLQTGDSSRPRVTFAQAVWEKVPLATLSFASVFLSLFSVRHQERIVEIYDAPLADRLANAVISSIVYVGKALWPAKLAVYYPLETFFPWWQVAGALLVLASVTGLVLYWRSRHPWLLAGWLWYLVTLFPVLGLVRDGLWPAMADRFAYTPFIGLYIIAAWGGAILVRNSFTHTVVVPCGAVLLLAALLGATYRQTSFWESSTSLFEHDLAVAGGNVIAFATLGEEYYRRGDLTRAATLFAKETELNPYTVNLEVNRGYAAYRQGDFDLALYSFRKALFKQPDHLDALHHLANLYEEQHRYDLAAAYYRKFITVAAARGGDFAGYRLAAEQDLARVGAKRLVAERLSTSIVAAHPSAGTDTPARSGFHTAILLKSRPGPTAPTAPASADATLAGP